MIVDLRELDADVAEIVFGWQREKAPADAHGQNGGTDFMVPPGFKWQGSGFSIGRGGTMTLPNVGRIGRAFLCPQWSSDRLQSLQLLSFLRECQYADAFISELAFEIVKAGGPDITCKCTACLFELMMATPEQICRAAIAARRSVKQ